MKGQPLFLLTLASAALLNAQTQEALDATRVDRFVVLALPPGDGLQFGADEEGRSRALSVLKSNHLFAARRAGGFNLVLAHVNPLRYAWTVSVNLTPDPLVESVTQFLAAAGKLFSAAGAPDLQKAVAAGPNTGAREATIAAADPTNARAAARALAEESLELTDASLIELRLWMTEKKDCFASTVAADDSKLVVAQRLDSTLFSSAPSPSGTGLRTAADFRTAVGQGIRLFDTPTSISDVREALESLRRVTTTLRDANARARSDREAITLANLPAARASTDPCGDMILYYRRTLDAYGRRAVPLIEKREELVARLQAVFDAIAQKIAATLPADKELLMGSVHVESGKRTTVTLTVTERAISFKDDVLSVTDVRSVTTTFGAMEHQSIVTEFTEGLAFTPVEFPRFQTNSVDGIIRVAEAGKSKPRFMLVSMLNLIPNAGMHGFTRLVGQLGAGITTEAAALLAGCGIRFTQPSRFVLTFGAMFPFVRSLTALKVGDAVAGEAALQADIGRTLAKRPSFYIGIQR
jgi:hypothetical protein